MFSYIVNLLQFQIRFYDYSTIFYLYFPSLLVSNKEKSFCGLQVKTIDILEVFLYPTKRNIWISKYVVTLDELAAGNINEVKIVHLADFLLNDAY